MARCPDLHKRYGVLDAPLSRGMTAEVQATDLRWKMPQATTIRLRNMVRDERPSRRSSLASERRASGA